MFAFLSGCFTAHCTPEALKVKERHYCIELRRTSKDLTGEGKAHWYACPHLREMPNLPPVGANPDCVEYFTSNVAAINKVTEELDFEASIHFDMDDDCSAWAERTALSILNADSVVASASQRGRRLCSDPPPPPAPRPCAMRMSVYLHKVPRFGQKSS